MNDGIHIVDSDFDSRVSEIILEEERFRKEGKRVIFVVDHGRELPNVAAVLGNHPDAIEIVATKIELIVCPKYVEENELYIKEDREFKKAKKCGFKSPNWNF